MAISHACSALTTPFPYVTTARRADGGGGGAPARTVSASVGSQPFGYTTTSSASSTSSAAGAGNCHRPSALAVSTWRRVSSAVASSSIETPPRRAWARLARRPRAQSRLRRVTRGRRREERGHLGRFFVHLGGFFVNLGGLFTHSRSKVRRGLGYRRRVGRWPYGSARRTSPRRTPATWRVGDGVLVVCSWCAGGVVAARHQLTPPPLQTCIRSTRPLGCFPAESQCMKHASTNWL